MSDVGTVLYCICFYFYLPSAPITSMSHVGTVLIAAFGLPPMSHDDDGIRGLNAALKIVNG